MATEIGASNPRLAEVRALGESRERRARQRFFFEGPILLGEALAAGFPIDELYATLQAYAAHAPLIAGAESSGIPVFLVPERAFGRLSDVETPTGILAVAPMRLRPLANALEGDGLVLVLAGLNDPGNAGTLVRSAEAFGVESVLFGRGGVDPYHPKVVRATMGSLFRTTVAVVDRDELVAAAAESKRMLVGLDLAGEPIDRVSLPERIVLAVGNERHGIRTWLPHTDRTVTIPQVGGNESLNAAIAGSIALYALSCKPS